MWKGQPILTAEPASSDCKQGSRFVSRGKRCRKDGRSSERNQRHLIAVTLPNLRVAGNDVERTADPQVGTSVI